MQQHNMSWIEVQFLKKAVDILCECRRTLMYTYVFAYYLRKNNQSEIFEVNHWKCQKMCNYMQNYLNSLHYKRKLFLEIFRKIKKTWKQQLKRYQNI